MFDYARHVQWIELQVASIGQFLTVPAEVLHTEWENNRCMLVRLETKKYMGELLVYSRGKCLFIVADLEMGEYVYERDNVDLTDDAPSCYGEFFKYFSS